MNCSVFLRTELLRLPARPLSLVMRRIATFPSFLSRVSGWFSALKLPITLPSIRRAARAYGRAVSARSWLLRIFTAETASIARVTGEVFLTDWIFVFMFFNDIVSGQ